MCSTVVLFCSDSMPRASSAVFRSVFRSRICTCKLFLEGLGVACSRCDTTSELLLLLLLVQLLMSLLLPRVVLDAGQTT
jgi:hypothetical protein